MRYDRNDHEIVVRLEAGERLRAGLREAIRTERVPSARVEAIGAVRAIRLRYFDPAAKRYEDHDIDEQLEVVSLIGSVTQGPDGSPKLHLHGALARRDLSVIGGHVHDAVAGPTLEVFLRVIAAVRRETDPDTGLDLLDLPGEKRLEEHAR